LYTSGKRIVARKVSSPREWIEYVGKDHLHHRLALVLGGAKRAVVVLLLLCMCLGISAVALRYARTIDSVLLIIQALMIILILTILERYGRTQVDKGKS
jgi:UDP-GlcNAc:undecaprenyl-phosphate GlcNAc-1-phosphate transferase